MQCPKCGWSGHFYSSLLVVPTDDYGYWLQCGREGCDWRMRPGSELNAMRFNGRLSMGGRAKE